MQNFLDKLNAAVDRNKSLLCVGLDVDREKIPSGVGVLEFNRRIIDATKDLVCAYKPNVAFYDLLPEGHQILEDTIKYIPSYIPVIGDSKRGDVDNTSRIHASVMFERFGFDAATVNAYSGRVNGVEPFLSYTNKGVFVWCRSSNEGAAEIQDLKVFPPGWPEDEEPPLLYEWIAMCAKKWNDANNVGVVASATFVNELKRVRELCPNMPILIPGVGAQRGPIEDSVDNGIDKNGRNAIINVARSIIYAERDETDDFDTAARRVAETYREFIWDRVNWHLQLRSEPLASLT